MPAVFSFTTPPALPPGLPGDTATASVVVPNARSLSATELTAVTRNAYRDLHDRLHLAAGRHVVRIWNYVPALLAAVGDGTNRYMAFNAGRYAAMRGWFGDDLAARAPAATGVGHPGDELIVHGLAVGAPGVAVQNPRQTPAVHYSARYGPRPPCFARAMRVGGVLLVSGTAGINGEDTAAPDDLTKQLDLTLEHLAALAGGLSKYRTLRAYVPAGDDVDIVRRRLAEAAPAAAAEFVVTDLCRPELRVEIEGVATESGTP